jgi:hypothetical protein
MLIPTYIIVFEVVLLEFFLIRTGILHKRQVGGAIALSLIAPVAYCIYAYLSTDLMGLQESQIMMRYGYAVLFLILDVIFIRLSRKDK